MTLLYELIMHFSEGESLPIIGRIIERVTYDMQLSSIIENLSEDDLKNLANYLNNKFIHQLYDMIYKTSLKIPYEIDQVHIINSLIRYCELCKKGGISMVLLLEKCKMKLMRAGSNALIRFWLNKIIHTDINKNEVDHNLQIGAKKRKKELGLKAPSVTVTGAIPEKKVLEPAQAAALSKVPEELVAFDKLRSEVPKEHDGDALIIKLDIYLKMMQNNPQYIPLLEKLSIKQTANFTPDHKVCIIPHTLLGIFRRTFEEYYQKKDVHYLKMLKEIWDSSYKIIRGNLKNEIPRICQENIRFQKEIKYHLLHHNFIESHRNEIMKYGDNLGIFRCKSKKSPSGYIYYISVDQLDVKSIYYKNDPAIMSFINLIKTLGSTEISFSDLYFDVDNCQLVKQEVVTEKAITMPEKTEILPKPRHSLFFPEEMGATEELAHRYPHLFEKSEPTRIVEMKEEPREEKAISPETALETIKEPVKEVVTEKTVETQIQPPTEEQIITEKAVGIKMEPSTKEVVVEKIAETQTEPSTLEEKELVVKKEPTKVSKKEVHSRKEKESTKKMPKTKKEIPAKRKIVKEKKTESKNVESPKKSETIKKRKEVKGEKVETKKEVGTAKKEEKMEEKSEEITQKKKEKPVMRKIEVIKEKPKEMTKTETTITEKKIPQPITIQEAPIETVPQKIPPTAAIVLENPATTPEKPLVLIKPQIEESETLKHAIATTVASVPVSHPIESEKESTKSVPAKYRVVDPNTWYSTLPFTVAFK